MKGWNEFKVQSSMEQFHEQNLRFFRAGNLFLSRVFVTFWLGEGQCCVNLPYFSIPDTESRRYVYDCVIISHSVHKYAASLCVCLELFVLSPFLFSSSYRCFETGSSRLQLRTFPPHQVSRYFIQDIERLNPQHAFLRRGSKAVGSMS